MLLEMGVMPSIHDALFWYNLKRNGEGDLRSFFIVKCSRKSYKDPFTYISFISKSKYVTITYYYGDHLFRYFMVKNHPYWNELTLL